MTDFPTAPGPDYLWTIDGAAWRLGISRRSVFAMLKRGDLRWVAVGGRRRITEKEIDRYLRSRTRRAA